MVLIGIMLLSALDLVLLSAEQSLLRMRTAFLSSANQASDVEPGSRDIRTSEASLAVCRLGIGFTSIALGAFGARAMVDIINSATAPLLAGPRDMSWMLAAVSSYLLIASVQCALRRGVSRAGTQRRRDLGSLSSKILALFAPICRGPMRVAAAAGEKLAALIRPSSDLPSEREVRLEMLSVRKTTGMPLQRLLMLENALDMSELRVRDVMRHRAFVKALWAEAPVSENYRVLRESRLSRLPLMKKGVEEPLGIIHVKDLVLGGLGDISDLEAIARPYHKTREETPAEDVLADLQRRGMHWAAVFDHSNKWTGILTLEDLLEELIGTVEDEFEIEPSAFLADALIAARVILGVEASSIEDAVRRAVEMIPRDALPIPSEEIIALVKNRTLSAVSFLGEGLVVVHGRTDLERSILIFARSENGIPVKGTPERAHLMFILLTPSSRPRVQARLLSRIGRLFDSEYVEQLLRTATSPEEVVDVIIAGERAALG